MDKLLSDVLRILREEVGLYRGLIEHARHKTALLVRGYVDDILESNKAEETFNLKLRILENEMSRLCRELCQVVRIPYEEFTLLKLADGLSQPVAAEIKTHAILFKHLIDELKSVNYRNIRLIESSVRYSRGLLDLLCGSSGSYRPDGLLHPAPAAQTTLSRRA